MVIRSKNFSRSYKFFPEILYIKHNVSKEKKRQVLESSPWESNCSCKLRFFGDCLDLLRISFIFIWEGGSQEAIPGRPEVTGTSSSHQQYQSQGTQGWCPDRWLSAWEWSTHPHCKWLSGVPLEDPSTHTSLGSETEVSAQNGRNSELPWSGIAF